MTKEIIKSEESLPKHIAIIMDGNGRWAKQHHLPRAAGHKKGLDATRATIEFSIKHKISQLTLFAFSSENWDRPDEEVNSLLDLFFNSLTEEVAELRENGVRIKFIGDLSAFSSKLINLMRDAEETTNKGDSLELNIAVNYGGRQDILQAADRALQASEKGERYDLEKHLYLQAPDPDLLIRTGGEHRISNFLLWNLAYTELFFTDVLWPDFGEQEFSAAVKWFATRDRRFGKV
ncbi:MAG: polyprenyl diphosphate synthase [Pseudomonadota bacterium]